MPKTYLFIPTYNERENIERRIREIAALKLDISILVVDDNSPDGTAAVVEQLQAEFPFLELLLRPDYRGRGSAGIAAFRYCLAHGADRVIEMDADSSHDPVYIPAMLAACDERTVVIGSRLLPGSRQVDRSPLRIFMTRVANGYCSWLFGLPVRDPIGGFKCYSRSMLATLDWDHFISRHYSIGVETLVKLADRGFGFKEIPIVFNDRTRGRSKFSLKIVIDFVKTIHLLKVRRRAQKI